jgi:hypothetical protein
MSRDAHELRGPVRGNCRVASIVSLLTLSQAGNEREKLKRMRALISELADRS